MAGEFDIAREAGTLAVATGPVLMDVWTFELSPGGEATRRTSGTAYYTDPAISPDGKTLYYLHGDVTGDNLYSLTLPTREEALTADSLPGGVNSLRVSRDGKRVTFAQFTPEGVRASVLDVATRQVSHFTPRVEMGFAPVPAGREFVIATDDALVVVDSSGATRGRLEIPITDWGGTDLAPDEEAVSMFVHIGEAWALITTPLSRWTPRTLHRFEPGDFPASSQWSDDGWISYKLIRGGRASIWRVRASGGTPIRRAPVPDVCTGSAIRIAAAAPRATCLAEDRRPDVWVMDLPALRQ
jgi:hypothetical protein